MSILISSVLSRLRRAFVFLSLVAIIAGSVLAKPGIVHATSVSFMQDAGGNGFDETITSSDPAFSDLDGATVDPSDFTVHGCTGGTDTTYPVETASFSTGTITLKLADPAGSEVPEGSGPDTGASCTVDYSGMQDLSTNPVAGTFTATDGASPVILYAQYLDQDANGIVDAVKMTLSEAVDPSSVCNNADWSTESGDFGSFAVACAGSLNISGNTITIPVNVNEEVRTSSDVSPTIKYVGTSHVVDASGNDLFAQVYPTLIQDDAAPVIESFSPADGAEGVSPSTQITITFSEPMDETTTLAATTLKRGTTSVPFTSGWNADDDVLTLTPSDSLGLASGYTVAVGTGAKSQNVVRQAIAHSVALDGQSGTHIDVPYGFDVSAADWAMTGVTRSSYLPDYTLNSASTLVSQQNGGGTGRSVVDIDTFTVSVPAGAPYIGTFEGGAQNNSSASGQSNAWDFWALSYDHGTDSLTFFENGQQLETITSVSPEMADGNFRLGSHKGGLINNLRGNFAQFSAFTRTLTPTEVSTWYKVGTVPTGAQVDYQFTNGSGSTITDVSGHSRNGTIVGGGTWATTIATGHEDESFSATSADFHVMAGGGVSPVTVSAPIAGTPLALSSDTIRWYFTDTATNESGFRIIDNSNGSDTIVADSGPNVATNLSHLDETGLKPSTQYCNRSVTAYNGAATSTLTALPCVTTLAVGEIATPPAEPASGARLSMTQSAYRIAAKAASTAVAFSFPLGAFWGSFAVGEIKVKRSRKSKKRKGAIPAHHHRFRHVSAGAFLAFALLGVVCAMSTSGVGAAGPLATSTGDLLLHPGDTVHVTFDVTNSGTGDASQVVFADDLPLAFTIDPKSLQATSNAEPVTATTDGSTVTVDLGSIPVSEEASVSYDAVVTRLGTFNHVAELTDADGITVTSNPLSFAISTANSTVPRFNAMTLLRTPTNPTVYLIDENGFRRPFLSAIVYATWFDSFKSVRVIADSEMTLIPLGEPMGVRPGTALVKLTTSPVVYAVEAGMNLQPIASESEAARLYGPNWNGLILDIHLPDLDRYRIRRTLPLGAWPDSLLITDGNTVCYLFGSTCRVVTENGMIANRLSTTFMQHVSADVINSLTKGDPIDVREVPVMLD